MSDSISLTSNARNIHIPSISNIEVEYKNNPKAGIALILNHNVFSGLSSRPGTEMDWRALEQTLSNYGFDVRVNHDLTCSQIRQLLMSVADEDHSKNDCLVVAVLSHGCKGKVYARDNAYDVEILWQYFMGHNCSSLVGKPKLFFIQACHGIKFDQPVLYQPAIPMDSQGFSEIPICYTSSNLPILPRKPPEQPFHVIPTTADLLIFYASFEKKVAFRDPKRGSWFIQTLVNVLEEARNGEGNPPEAPFLMDLLITICRRVAFEFMSDSIAYVSSQQKEMPAFTSTLTKKFRLRVKPNRGLFDELNVYT